PERDCTNVFRGAQSFPEGRQSMSSDDHNQDRDRDHANDNGKHERPGSKVAPAPTRGALTSLAALQAALAKVNTATIIGRSGKPMMLFKSRENSGTYGYGQKRTMPEAGSKWAINPTTFQYGYICFEGNKVLGEHLVSVSLPMPVLTELPDLGAPWQEEWAVGMKCLNGVDGGVEVIFKTNTNGGNKAIAGQLDLVRNRLNSELQKEPEECDGKIVPIVLLEKDSYQHAKYGQVWEPVLNTIDWMSL